MSLVAARLRLAAAAAAAASSSAARQISGVGASSSSSWAAAPLLLGPRGWASAAAAVPAPQPQQQQQRQAPLTLASLGIPEHEVEEDLPVLRAVLRSPKELGSRACERLRRAGRTPAQLYSLPAAEATTTTTITTTTTTTTARKSSGDGPRLPLALGSAEAAAAVRRFGRNGVQARPFRLELYDAAAGDPWRAAEAEAERERRAGEQTRRSGGVTAAPASSSSSSSTTGPPPRLIGAVRVLPQAVHVNSVTLRLENLGLLFCPRDRARVDVSVPVEIWNSEASPGVRRGGWMQTIRRAVPLSVRGSHIPPRLELDVAHMKAWDVIRLADVPLKGLSGGGEGGEAGAVAAGGEKRRKRRPAPVRLRARDPTQPVVRCTLRVGGE